MRLTRSLPRQRESVSAQIVSLHANAERLVDSIEEKSIRKYMPDMLIEYNPENVRQFGYDPKDTLHLLTSWGYNISFVDYEDILCVKDIKNNNKL